MNAPVIRTVPVDANVRELASGMMADAQRLFSICSGMWTTPERANSILPLATAINAQSRQLMMLAHVQVDQDGDD